ncbi:putative membrane protein YgcG [Kineococcus radiotolerans]|uniref:Putative membrane protein YgcG n=1 Tax=Kineococcus radiotolerans TaxID=131568 RepID=A0A7W4TI66_KINRA|nr:hypothetical protein [Kineococcus radiotolerans]MBB2899379.1 putative membrane protein YgcG [Kineococcus radiotolerans]
MLLVVFLVITGSIWLVVALDRRPRRGPSRTQHHRHGSAWASDGGSGASGGGWGGGDGGGCGDGGGGGC